MANKKPINKDNPKNIYCDHCEHYGHGNMVDFCKCVDSPHFLKERRYWHRCKCFEWRKEDGK